MNNVPHLRVALLAAALGLLTVTAGADNLKVTDVIEPVGEPYELLGHRLVFTSWYYIRPGQYHYFIGNREVGLGNEAALGEAQYRPSQVPTGIEIVTRPAQKSGPLFALEKPWETQGIFVGSLLHDGPLFRAWAHTMDASGKTFRAYYESKDGLHWARPTTSLKYDGQPSNLFNLPPSSSFNIFIDPSAAPAERYKAFVTVSGSPQEIQQWRKQYPEQWVGRPSHLAGAEMATWGYVSADGIAWLKQGTLLSEYNDTWNGGYYDQRLKKYVLFTRNYLSGPRSEKVEHDVRAQGGQSRRRAIGRTESDNFQHFPASDVILFPTTMMKPSEHVYTNCKTTIPGAPDQHLLFPTLYDVATDQTRVVVAASDDGRHWEWLNALPVLAPGKHGDWDGGCLFATPELVELPDGDFALPYVGHTVPHKYPRHGAYRFNTGYALWPKGRLVALTARDQGSFTTVGLIVPGQKLKINAVTQTGGKIVIQIIDPETNRPLGGRTFEACNPIVGDNFWTTVTWGKNNTLGVAANQPVALQFKMEHADIYGLDFE